MQNRVITGVRVSLSLCVCVCVCVCLRVCMCLCVCLRQTGATLEYDATMLEHTLILPGDRADANTTWQGWPAHVVAREFKDFSP